MIKRLISCSLLLTLFGCASISDYRYRYTNEKRAKQCWREVKSCYPAEECTRDFQDGFIDGYVDAARGGDGTPPPVPPNCYWGAKFQSPEGLARVHKWYSGFTAGANAALQAGRSYYSPVPSRVQ